VVPNAIPDKTPVEALMVPMAGADVDHVPPEVVLLSVAVADKQTTAGVGVIAAGVG
jgi:hypothetical protein